MMINGGKWGKDGKNATFLPSNFVGMRTIIMS